MNELARICTLLQRAYHGSPNRMFGLGINQKPESFGACLNRLEKCPLQWISIRNCFTGAKSAALKASQSTEVSNGCVTSGEWAQRNRHTSLHHEACASIVFRLKQINQSNDTIAVKRGYKITGEQKIRFALQGYRDALKLEQNKNLTST